MGMQSLILWALRFWLVFVFVRILMHGIKNAFLIPRIGNQRSHILVSFIMITVILILTYFLTGTEGVRTNPGQLLMIGLLWSCLTVIADFIVLKFLFGEEISDILYNYKLNRGRFHFLVILVMLISPLILGYLIK